MAKLANGDVCEERNFRMFLTSCYLRRVMANATAKFDFDVVSVCKTEIVTAVSSPRECRVASGRDIDIFSNCDAVSPNAVRGDGMRFLAPCVAKCA